MFLFPLISDSCYWRERDGERERHNVTWGKDHPGILRLNQNNKTTLIERELLIFGVFFFSLQPTEIHQ